MTEVDLFVIGGGSGGVRAARIAAGHGARVALAEEYRMGGTCVIRGCVPKKLMVLASRFSDTWADAAEFGWQLEGTRFEWPRLAAAVAAEVRRLEGLYTSGLQRAGVELLAERAVLEDAQTVRLAASGRLFKARHVLLATGAAPAPSTGFPGAEHVENSNDFFTWAEQPQRVIVFGAGYVALELACLLQRLGSEVHVVYRGERILRGFDEELSEHLQRQLVADGLRLHAGRRPALLERLTSPDQPSGLRLTLDDGSVLLADRVLGATGRLPNTRGLGLEPLGVRLAANGAVEVDEFASTSVPNIHAVGDVTGRLMLTPAAIREGHALADALFGAERRAVVHRVVPTAVFTTPELGTVGLSEAQALEQHADIDVYTARFRPMASVFTRERKPHQQTLLKLVVRRSDDRVLGAHMVGPEAAEMIQLLGVALQMGARKADLDATLAVHPSAAEEWVTMRTPTRQHGRGAD